MEEAETMSQSEELADLIWRLSHAGGGIAAERANVIADQILISDWLAKLKQDVRAATFDEGAELAFKMAIMRQNLDDVKRRNPYRKR